MSLAGRCSAGICRLLGARRGSPVRPLRPPPDDLGAATLRRIESTPPAAALRALLLSLVGLVLALLVWALTARLDIVASAPGRLVPQSQVKVVQTAEPGIVREILVREGDAVRAGQVLARLDATVAGADAAQLAHERALRAITVRAIDAALDGRAMEPGADDPPALYAQVARQFAARAQALADSIAQETQAAQRVAHDRAAAQQVRDKLAATLPVVRRSADSFARLHADGFVGELLAADKRKELIQHEQDLKAQEAALQALDAAQAQAASRIAQLRSAFRSQLLTERVEAVAALNRLDQEHARLGFRAGQLELRAPQDGVVHNLATHTAGAVLQAGAALLTLVPRGDRLRAEALLANEDVGFVAAGQRVRLKLAAYPFQKYGLLEGRVVHLSADAEAPEAAARATGNPYAVPPLAYKAVIELDAQALPLPGGGQLPLAPGMAVTAEIHQGRRSVLEYLLSPVQRVTAEALRER